MTSRFFLLPKPLPDDQNLWADLDIFASLRLGNVNKHKKLIHLCPQLLVLLSGVGIIVGKEREKYNCNETNCLVLNRIIKGQRGGTLCRI